MTESNYPSTGPTVAQANPADASSSPTSHQSAPAGATTHLREQAEQAWQTTREHAGTALHSGEDYVRANPLPTVFGALAVGFVLGLACGSHRQPPSLKSRYFDEPLDRTHGAVLGALLAIAAAGRSLFNSASSCSRETADDLRRRSKPLAKAAKRAGKKLHFN